MILKTSTLALCSTSNLPTFVWPFGPAPAPTAAAGSPCTSTTSGRPRICASPTGLAEASWQAGRGVRRYATAHHPAEDWSPLHWPTSTEPTPYQIFNQKRDAPYSKARFYQLVKLYHPDRHRHTVTGVSNSIRLERYRLVVAANDILCDPAKRRAYDLYGAGWGQVRSMNDFSMRETDRSWRKRPGNPSMNATWEDWESWYAQRDGTEQKQQTLYMSNELFVVLIFAIVIVVSVGRMQRAAASGNRMQESADERHWAIRYYMARRGTELGDLSKHERIETFLRQREGWDLSAAVSAHHGHSSFED